ncbi:hypothetical protein GCE9029_01656 [Grimontia celer]|uniref:Uncharacterized protein n=1 Tax=Grimontia celer TaxID=1796497 RepID=A0A128EZ19_9GAMM|nr:hypothetical protein [Grimontia celer]CZF79798.1 hypothetical protein GCE9029_01656 [Grimontia celer]
MKESKKTSTTIQIITIIICCTLYTAIIYNYFGIVDSYDLSRYISAGIALLEEQGLAPHIQSYTELSFSDRDGQLVYPSAIFQVIAALLSGSLYSTPSIHLFYAFTVAIFTLSNIIIFKILNHKIDKNLALIITVSMLLIPYNMVFSENMTRPLTGPWGMFFWLISIYFIINKKVIKAGLTSGLALLIRIQTYQLVFLEVILIEKWKERLRYLLSILVTVLIFQAFFYLLISTPNGNSSFYLDAVKTIDPSKIKQSFLLGFEFLLIMKVYSIFALIIIPFLFSSVVSRETKSFILYYIAFYFVLFFATIIAMPLVYNANPNTRYFIYLYPFIPIIFGFIISDFSFSNSLIFNRKITILLSIITISILSLHLFNSIKSGSGNDNAIKEIYSISDHLDEDIKNPVILTNDRYIPSYIFSSIRSRKFYNLPSLEDFTKSNHNNKIDFIIFSFRHHKHKNKITSLGYLQESGVNITLNTPLIDNNGNTFIYESKTSELTNMIIYKRKQ